MNRLNGRSVALERQATALLQDSPVLATKRGAGLISVSDRELDKRLTRQKRIADNIEAEAAFRAMPKASRRSLTEEFKSLPAELKRQGWFSWLIAKLENTDGMPVHGESAVHP